MGQEGAGQRALVLFCPGWRMDVTKRFSALGNGVKLVNFPDWRNTSNLWHIKHRGGSHLVIQSTSGKVVQRYENPKHSKPRQSDPRHSPCPCPCPASALCGPCRHRGEAGTGAGKGPPSAGAASPGKRLPGALYGRASGHVNSDGGRGRGAAAAGQLVSYGGVGALPPARLPPLHTGDEGREAGTLLPPPLSRRDPPCSGRVRGGAGSPPQAPAAAPPGGKGPVKTRARHKTRALPRLEPGGLSGLSDSFNRSCSRSLAGVELLCSVRLPLWLRAGSQEQVTAVRPASSSEWFCSASSFSTAITYNGFYIEPLGQE